MWLDPNKAISSPRWASQFLQRTSVLTIPKDLSECLTTLSGPEVSKKLGQPVPESNLWSEENRSASQQAHLYMPVDKGAEIGARYLNKLTTTGVTHSSDNRFIKLLLI